MASPHAEPRLRRSRCNVGGGDVTRSVYRVSMYAHDEGEVGKYEKRLLHDPREEAVGGATAQ